MKALITGSNGLVGSHLVEALLQQNYSVRCLIRKTSNIQYIKALPVEFLYGELLDEKSLKPAVEDVDYVFHVGALTKALDPFTFYTVNVDGTRKLYRACQTVNPNIKRFLFVSSQAAAGPSYDTSPISESDACHPISDYGKSKYEAEIFLRAQTDIPWTIVRPPSVFGPRDSDVYTIFKLVSNRITPIIGDGNYYINLIYVKDLAAGIIQAAISEKSIGETYFLADRSAYSWSDFSALIEDALQISSFKLNIPLWLAYSVASLNELLSKLTRKSSILTRQKFREFTQRYWLCTSAKARTHFDFSTRPINEAINDTIEWYKEKNWL
jgi:nucleoside-diphosphate-sugar epimerase